jgi:hypothetical protein
MSENKPALPTSGELAQGTLVKNDDRDQDRVQGTSAASARPTERPGPDRRAPWRRLARATSGASPRPQGRRPVSPAGLASFARHSAALSALPHDS